MSEWQPIETAPRDRDILVCDKRGMIWISKWGFKYGGPVTWRLVDLSDDPTHWLSIPEPPK